MKYTIKKIENMSLTKQLILVTLIALAICSIIVGVVLPKILIPFYENSVYAYLKQPSKFIEPNTNKMSEDVAFIIITKSGAIYTSDNLNKIIPNVTTDKIISSANASYGKFKLSGATYYYVWGEKKDGQKNLIITDNTQVREEEKSLLSIIFPTIVATIFITVLLLVTWSQYILRKIKKIDKKTKALITCEKVDESNFIIDDELNNLSNTIDTVRNQLKEKDEYKNMMFQNLSHELKTPIAVIQSYVEAVEDDVVDKDEAIKIISEETSALSNQVKTILQINKIDYMKDSKEYQNSKVNISEIIEDAVTRHKLLRNDLSFSIMSANDDENNIFKGTESMWKAVFDNILGNFVRYAKTSIEITIKDNKIILFNDGEAIENNIISTMFLPYVKGKEGQSGLGLYIAKKTVNMFGYDITAENVPNGVQFIIK